MVLLPARPSNDRPPQSSGSRSAATRGMFRGRTPHRPVLLGCSVLVIVYSVVVLAQVAWMGDIGVRCIFGVDLKEPVSEEYHWSKKPRVGDTLEAIGGSPIINYTDYIRALRRTSRRVGE